MKFLVYFLLISSLFLTSCFAKIMQERENNKLQEVIDQTDCSEEFLLKRSDYSGLFGVLEQSRKEIRFGDYDYHVNYLSDDDFTLICNEKVFNFYFYLSVTSRDTINGELVPVSMVLQKSCIDSDKKIIISNYELELLEQKNYWCDILISTHNKSFAFSAVSMMHHNVVPEDLILVQEKNNYQIKTKVHLNDRIVFYKVHDYLQNNKDQSFEFDCKTKSIQEIFNVN